MNVEDLRKHLADLSPERRALLVRRLAKTDLLAASPMRMPRRAGTGPCTLSFAQQRLWFLDQMEPHTCVYNIPHALRLRGCLNVDALRGSLEAIVARHEALRTTFVVTDGEPQQVVAERRTVALAVADLRALPAPEREAELARTLRAEARRPFNLAADLMIRGLLVQLEEQEHVLLLTLHHIASDGWSMGILLRELGELYSAFCGSRPSTLPALPIQYGDYAVWQRTRLQTDELTTQLAYWKARLAGMPPTLQLPTDRPRPAVQTHRGAQETATLSRALTDALTALSQRERATLFVTLLAAFQMLLHRYARTDDVVVGTAVAGRRHVETEGLIGFFVNTLALRTDLSGDPAFRELLGRVRETVVGAYDHQDLPFDKVVEELRPARSLSWTPLVQVMFTLEEGEQRGPELPDLLTSPMGVDLEAAKFDLIAAARRDPAGLRVTLGYNADLYEAGTIRRMLGHYERLLAGIAADPTRRLSDFPLLTDAERDQLVAGRHRTHRPFPETASIAALFEAQVSRAPEAVAVLCEEQTLTYRQLNERANQLAHYLRRRGVGPEVAVGICLAPSLELIVGLLAILKAGGVYVPLDPTYPKERLAFMLEDAQVAALVTRQDLVPGLPAVTVPIIALDECPHATESTDDPPHEATGEHLAYLMYTSGSTGRPKAVAVAQRGVTRLVLNTDYVTLTVADVVAQASTVAFDAATFEIWGALLNGARLVVIPRDIVLSPLGFSAELKRHGVTILFLTTALFNQMAREAPASFRTLHTLLVGGEAAEPRWFDAVLRHEPPQRLLNVYGPTETTTFACWYPVENVPTGAASIPIGRPISNTQVYVLDGQLNPVPVGVPGELYIGGPGVARGYHRRPDLTEEKFVPDPFGNHAGARLYKTGDLGRYLADSNIEFLARIDEQVKIRGHRIEPGEIEAALRQHPAVRDVVVVTREDVPGDKYLVAYVVPTQPSSATIGTLRGALKERLPGYMIPAHIVKLDALPLGPNGKVDRHALPAPEAAQHERAPGGVEPSTPLEEQLTGIWEDLLDIRPIGTTDNFFDLGGHSLLAVQVMNAIEATTGRRLPVSILFTAATIQQLARAIQQVEMPSSPVTAIHPSGSRPPLFFLAGDIAGGGFYCMKLARVLGPEQPFFMLHAHGFDGRAIPASIEVMAADYVARLRALQSHGPYRLGGYCNGGLVAFEMARQLRAQGEKVDLLALLETPAVNTWFGVGVLRGLVSCVGAVARLAPHERLERFVQLRQRVLGLRRRAGDVGRCVRELCRLDYVERAAVSGSAARQRGASLSRILWRQRDDAGELHASPRRSPAAAGPPRPPEDAYGRVIAGYVPRRYDGTITLFRAAEGMSGRRDLGWRDLARDVQVHVTPGDHLTCIGPHVAALGELLNACLQKAQAK